MNLNHQIRSHRRNGFTILESVIAILLLSVAATMVYSVTYPAMNQAYHNRNQTVANQFASQLLTEMLQLPLDSVSSPTVPVLDTPYQDRSSLSSIQAFDGFATHACFADGTKFEAEYSASEIATTDSICYLVSVEDVGGSFETGGGSEFSRITISAFLDPDQNRQPDGRPMLFSLTHYLSRVN